MTFAPPNALKLWATSKEILVELPGPGTGVTILRYPRNSLGLSKIVALIAPAQDYSGGEYIEPRAKRPAGTIAQQTLAESLLRKRGIIK